MDARISKAAAGLEVDWCTPHAETGQVRIHAQQVDNEGERLVGAEPVDVNAPISEINAEIKSTSVASLFRACAAWLEEQSGLTTTVAAPPAAEG